MDNEQSDTSQSAAGNSVEGFWSQSSVETNHGPNGDQSHEQGSRQNRPLVREDQPNEGQATAGQQSEAQQAAVTPAIREQAAQQGIDPQALANAIVQAQEQARQSQERNKFSQEDFNKQFGVFEVDKEQFGAMFGVDPTDEQAQAFNQIIRRTANMAVKMAEFKAQQQIAKLQQMVNPALKTVQDINRRAMENKFAERHPQLKAHQPLVRNVVSALIQQGKKFKSAEEAMDAAASEAKKILQQSGVNLEQAQPTQQGNQQQASVAQGRKVTRPARASVGGGGGTTGSASSTQNTVQKIWG